MKLTTWTALTGFGFGLIAFLLGVFGVFSPRFIEWTLNVERQPNTLFITLSSMASLNMGAYYCLAALFDKSLNFFIWTVPFRCISVIVFFANFQASLALYELFGAIATGYSLFFLDTITIDFDLQLSLNSVSNIENIKSILADPKEAALKNPLVVRVEKIKENMYQIEDSLPVNFLQFQFKLPLKYTVEFSLLEDGRIHYTSLSPGVRTRTVYSFENESNGASMLKEKTVITCPLFLQDYVLNTAKTAHLEMLTRLKLEVERKE